MAELILGTAQLGLDYGISNARGKPSEGEAFAILDTAWEQGVRTLDTARAYGDSEEIVARYIARTGRLFAVQSKIQPIDPQAPQSVSEQLRISVETTLENFPGIQLLQFHRMRDATPALVTELRQLLGERSHTRIGVSVQTPEELRAASEIEGIVQVQMPANLLDGRWNAHHSRRRMTYQARSVFLQGLLLSGGSGLWVSFGAELETRLGEWLGALLERLERESVLELCLAYVQGLRWVDAVIVGASTQQEVIEIARAHRRPPLTSSELLHVRESRPSVPSWILDPSKWSKFREPRPPSTI